MADLFVSKFFLPSAMVRYSFRLKLFSNKRKFRTHDHSIYKSIISGKTNLKNLLKMVKIPKCNSIIYLVNFSP